MATSPSNALTAKALLPAGEDLLGMSGDNSRSSATPEKPDRAIRKDQTLGEKIEALPNTVLFFVLSFGIFLSAMAVNVLEFRVLAGVLGATSVMFMALAVITHVVYFLLGLID